MTRPTQMRAVRSAAEIAGGTNALAAYLEVSPLAVAAWMEGASEVPAAVFLRIVEILIERRCARADGTIPTGEAEAFRYREAANS